VLPQNMNVEQMEKGNGELLELMMNSKIEMKLRQLLEICFQLREMMTKSLLNMEEAYIDNVCKVTTTKVEDFDKATLIVQICIGKFRMKDVLLDNEFSVNINLKSLRKKLGLRKPKLTPFVVRMVDQRKV
jgi:hypothetical protein